MHESRGTGPLFRSLVTSRAVPFQEASTFQQMECMCFWRGWEGFAVDTVEVDKFRHLAIGLRAPAPIRVPKCAMFQSCSLMDV